MQVSGCEFRVKGLVFRVQGFRGSGVQGLVLYEGLNLKLETQKPKAGPLCAGKGRSTSLPCSPDTRNPKP
jgi:hypothetical protein